MVGAEGSDSPEVSPASKPSHDLYRRYVGGGAEESVKPGSERSAQPATERSPVPQPEPEKPGWLSKIKEAWNSVTEAGGKVVEAGKKAWDSGVQAVKDFVSHPIDTIAKGWNSLTESIGNFISSIGDFVSNLSKSIGSWSSGAAKGASEGSGFYGTEAKLMTYVVEVAKQAAVESEKQKQELQERSQREKQYISGALEYGNDAIVASKMHDIYATPQDVAAAISSVRQRKEAEKLQAEIARTEAQMRTPGTSPDVSRQIQEKLGASGGKADHHELLAVEKEAIKKAATGSTETEVADGTRRAGQLLASRLSGAAANVSGAAAQLGELLYRHRDDEGVREMLDNPASVSKGQMAEVMRRLNVQINA